MVVVVGALVNVVGVGIDPVVVGGWVYGGTVVAAFVEEGDAALVVCSVVVSINEVTDGGSDVVSTQPASSGVNKVRA